MNEDKLRNIPLAALDFACEGCVEMHPARFARERVAPAPPTSARAPALLSEHVIYQQATAAERAVQAERVRERSIRDAAEPEQAELVEDLVAAGIELEEALTMLALDLLERCEQLEELQRSEQ